MRITRVDLIKNAKLLMSEDNEYKLPDLSSSINSVGLTETIINAFFVTQIIHFQIELKKSNLNLPRTLNFSKDEAEAFKEIPETDFRDKNLVRVLKKIRKHLKKEFNKYQPSINTPARKQLLNLVTYLIDKELILHKNSPAFVFLEKIDLDPIFAIFSSHLIELDLEYRAQNFIDADKEDFGKLLKAIQDPRNYDNNHLSLSGMIKKVPEWSTLMSSTPDKIKTFIGGKHSDIMFSRPTRYVLFSMNTQEMQDAKEQFLQNTKQNAMALFEGLMSDFNLQEQNLSQPTEDQSLSQIKNPAVLMYMLKEGIDLLNQCLEQNDSIIERLSEVKPIISHDELSSHFKSLYAPLTSIEKLKLAIHKEQQKIQRRNTVGGSELKLIDFSKSKSDRPLTRHSAITTNTGGPPKPTALVSDTKTNKYTNRKLEKPLSLPKNLETNIEKPESTSSYLTVSSLATGEESKETQTTTHTSKPVESGGIFSSFSFKSLISFSTNKEPSALRQDQSNSTASSSSSSSSSTTRTRSSSSSSSIPSSTPETGLMSSFMSMMGRNKAPEKPQVPSLRIEDEEPETYGTGHLPTVSNSGTPPGNETLLEGEGEVLDEIEQQDGALIVNLNSSANRPLTERIPPNRFISAAASEYDINNLFDDLDEPEEPVITNNSYLFSIQSTTDPKRKEPRKLTRGLYSTDQITTLATVDDGIFTLREKTSKKKKLLEKETNSNTNPPLSGTDDSKSTNVKSLVAMFAKPTPVVTTTPLSISQGISSSSSSSSSASIDSSSSPVKDSSTTSSSISVLSDNPHSSLGLSSQIPAPIHSPKNKTSMTLSYSTSSIFSSSFSISSSSSSSSSSKSSIGPDSSLESKALISNSNPETTPSSETNPDPADSTSSEINTDPETTTSLSSDASSSSSSTQSSSPTNSSEVSTARDSQSVSALITERQKELEKQKAELMKKMEEVNLNPDSSSALTS